MLLAGATPPRHSAWSKIGLLFLLFFGVSAWPPWENEWREVGVWIATENLSEFLSMSALLPVWRVTLITGFKVLKIFFRSDRYAFFFLSFFPINLMSWYTCWYHPGLSHQFHTEIRPSAITAALKMPFLSAVTAWSLVLRSAAVLLNVIFWICLRQLILLKSTLKDLGSFRPSFLKNNDFKRTGIKTF